MAHQFSCSACGFQVRSDDGDEVIELVRGHASDKHDMELSEGDVHDGWEEVSLSADD